uniref:NADH-ubiquinone oxidoreductase chain 4L n=1 Tax=Pseudolestes mirabilis TaxID=476809 RepID=D2DNI4_9ODON|nr:NADH dehydrogenase subunit 4L [Pseudolestes mirabilis]ACM63343.1 NADH dehydrogenase subunit 4L [Pseudolestes mirabilis]
MVSFYKGVFLFICLFGIYSFVSNSKHLLCALLSLEFIVLCLFFFMSVIFVYQVFDLYFLMYFLTFSVCEGALGISVLVSMIRSHGTDYFSSYNLLQC